MREHNRNRKKGKEQSSDNVQCTYRDRFYSLRKGTLLKRWQKYAYWTLPQYILPDGHTKVEQPICRDYQEMGALLVNNLASKLAGLLFPPGRAFFKAEPSAEMLYAAKKQGYVELDLQNQLAIAEVAASKALYVNAAYAQINTALKLLIITGNALVFRDTERQTIRVYSPQNYVTIRAPDGTVVEVVLREQMAFGSIDAEYQNKLRGMHAKYRNYQPDSDVWRFTRIVLEQPVMDSGKARYVETQQLDDLQVDYRKEYPIDICPWMAPMWNHISGEHYGRGLVEDFAGGFAKLSAMMESGTLYAVEIMKILNLVAPQAMADLEELNNAVPGQYVQGVPGQIAPYMQGDARKLEDVRAVCQDTIQSLAKAFMFKGNTRDAEGVTEYELRLDAAEAEQTLGGAYSTLAAALQLPMARVLFSEQQKDFEVGVVLGHFTPRIVSGLQSLGRSADVQNLVAAAQEIAAIVPVLTQADSRIDPQKVIDMIMMARSVDFQAIQKTQQQIQEEQQAKTQQLQGQQQIAQAQAMSAQADQLQALGQ